MRHACICDNAVIWVGCPNSPPRSLASIPPLEWSAAPTARFLSTPCWTSRLRERTSRVFHTRYAGACQWCRGFVYMYDETPLCTHGALSSSHMRGRAQNAKKLRAMWRPLACMYVAHLSCLCTYGLRANTSVIPTETPLPHHRESRSTSACRQRVETCERRLRPRPPEAGSGQQQ